mmetsp:Transcript_156934/g.278433  ORF Transcript_156934/g.278433 Transcript_156934/m.278433 type:complete len:204 (-) Transcript_156934:892-1503(-)
MLAPSLWIASHTVPSPGPGAFLASMRKEFQYSFFTWVPGFTSGFLGSASGSLPLPLPLPFSGAPGAGGGPLPGPLPFPGGGGAPLPLPLPFAPGLRRKKPLPCVATANSLKISSHCKQARFCSCPSGRGDFPLPNTTSSSADPHSSHSSEDTLTLWALSSKIFSSCMQTLQSSCHFGFELTSKHSVPGQCSPKHDMTAGRYFL